jgi:hypothetical protein
MPDSLGTFIDEGFLMLVPQYKCDHRIDNGVFL